MPQRVRLPGSIGKPIGEADERLLGVLERCGGYDPELACNHYTEKVDRLFKQNLNEEAGALRGFWREVFNICRPSLEVAARHIPGKGTRRSYFTKADIEQLWFRKQTKKALFPPEFEDSLKSAKEALKDNAEVCTFLDRFTDIKKHITYAKNNKISDERLYLVKSVSNTRAFVEAVPLEEWFGLLRAHCEDGGLRTEEVTDANKEGIASDLASKIKDGAVWDKVFSRVNPRLTEDQLTSGHMISDSFVNAFVQAMVTVVRNGGVVPVLDRGHTPPRTAFVRRRTARRQNGQPLPFELSVLKGSPEGTEGADLHSLASCSPLASRTLQVEEEEEDEQEGSDSSSSSSAASSSSSSILAVFSGQRDDGESGGGESPLLSPGKADSTDVRTEDVRLNRDLADTRAENDWLRRDLEDARDTIAGLRETNDRAGRDLEEAREAIAGLREKNDRAGRDLEDARDTIAGLQEKMVEMQRDHVAERMEVDEDWEELLAKKSRSEMAAREDLQLIFKEHVRLLSRERAEKRKREGAERELKRCLQAEKIKTARAEGARDAAEKAAAGLRADLERANKEKVETAVRQAEKRARLEAVLSTTATTLREIKGEEAEAAQDP
jgi:hypothetical protein